MKKFYYLFIALTISFLSIRHAQAQNVNIPDSNFKAALVANTDINTNSDGEIQISEAVAYTGPISVSSKSIGDLTGIEAFTGITELYCYSNNLTVLDVSQNTSLQYLDCYQNQLTNLNVSTPTLKYLTCSNNQLTNLNISSNTALLSLQCDHNQLSNLDVSANTVLQDLQCNSNQLTNLNVSANIALTGLLCLDNQLPQLDVSGNPALTSLNCSYNYLTNLDVSANTSLILLACASNQLIGLNTSANTALEGLYCNINQLSNLDLSANTKLTNLICSDNQLTNLDVSANTALTYIECNTNQISNLNVSANHVLTSLVCHSNQLTSLDISANTSLVYLECSDNQLTDLNIPFAIHLSALSCAYNQLTGLNIAYTTALTQLVCRYNQIASLGLSSYTALNYLDCGYNNLSSLDIKNGNTANWNYFAATFNPSLTCIQVDDAAYMNATWSANKDAGANFNINCPGCIQPTITSNPAVTTDLCPGTAVKLTSSAASNYLWSTGATKRSITVKKEGSYTVSTTNTATGCTATSAAAIVTYQPCNTPTNIGATVTATSAIFNFTGNSCAAKYELEFRQKGTTGWIVIDSVYASPFTQYGLSPNTKYEYRIRTICRTQPLRQSVFSAKQTFITSASLFAQNQAAENISATGSSFTITVSPNPAKSNALLHISKKPQNVSVTITDMYGKVLWQLQQVTNETVNLPVQNFAAGIYTVSVSDNKEARMIKLIKQ